MKGYNTSEGYFGWIPSENRYILFASEQDYIDYLTSDDCMELKGERK